MKKHQIDFGTEEEFLLFGVVSGELPQRLAFLMNETLNYAFKRKNEIPFYNGQEKLAEFPRFDFIDELNRIQIHLLGNRDESNCLLPELRQVDYLIMVKGALDYIDPEDLIAKLKSVETVQLVTRLHKKQLKSYQNLIIPIK